MYPTTLIALLFMVASFYLGYRRGKWAAAERAHSVYRYYANRDAENPSVQYAERSLGVLYASTRSVSDVPANLEVGINRTVSDLHPHPWTEDRPPGA